MKLQTPVDIKGCQKKKKRKVNSQKRKKRKVNSHKWVYQTVLESISQTEKDRKRK
jgi:hypothetical protein